MYPRGLRARSCPVNRRSRPFLELAHEPGDLLHCRPLPRSQIMPIVNRIADLHAEITAWRHDLHAHPELLYDVHRTAGERRREAQGLRLRRGGDRASAAPAWSASSAAARAAARQGRSACAPTWTRCRSRRRPACPTSRPCPARCTPAAMTATPPCCSAPRKYLAETRNFAGTAVVIFQPAEEGGGGGREHGQRRHDGPLRHRGGLRHAQLSRHAGRRIRHPRRAR